MSQIYVLGPAHIAVGTGASGAYEYLGVTDEQGCRILVRGAFEPVMTDQGGPGIPHDYQFFGEDASISFITTKFNFGILQKLMSRKLGGSVGGAMAAHEIGSLMIQEGRTVGVLVKAPYAVKTAFNTMVAGFRFPTAFPNDAFEFGLSSRAMRQRVLLQATPVFNSDGSYLLYDHDLTDFPAHN